ncbi:protein PHOTOPERIOD-INDEPENDENT EARLY FLOWERING 1 isoform X3 [Syzygium oleosum]|uniref:protein PHOTOPERIOD-INDEPENDENT EARLY FLOWERING 1 isoform X3 n=1 Tax=Syzygium oleosum TaxID=219896 RepID=UPI0024B8AFA0|nr:protein PHOTOPERIOD-INDEPENDENT EARLY FLOWERING 1 isoform X3 [Syzygium oleosum]
MASKGPRSKLDHETRARRQKALEAPREPRRPKSHWDHVLEEMIWLSKDFESERKWKLAQAKKVAIRASKGMLDQATREERKMKEEEQKLRKVALNISKDVKKFWMKIEKLVLYKHQLEVDEKRKKALDKQLEFLLGQTERYSTMLAENLTDACRTLQPNNTEEHQPSISLEDDDENLTIEGMELDAESRPETANVDEDFSLQTEDELEDDEQTMEEDEALITEEERKEELEALHEEMDVPLEELLKQYVAERGDRDSPGGSEDVAQQNSDEKDQDECVQKDLSAAGKTNEDSSIVVTGRRCAESNGSLSVPKSLVSEMVTCETESSSKILENDKDHVHYDFLEEQEDGDYVLAGGEDKAQDDEATLLEEEELAKADTYDPMDEIALLQRESEIPVEELIARYKKDIDNDAVSEDESEYASALSEDLEDAAGPNYEVPYKESMSESDGELHANLSDSSPGKEAEAVEPNESEVSESDNRIADAAAAARSAQPTGNTFSTTKVRTKFPFLIKHPLREYQHIGLDWLVTMYEKRLNGILADEMGLGKTIMTIALLAHLACEKGIWGPHLIVVPTSVMLNWETEFLKWCPAFKILTYFGSAKERKFKRQGWLKPNSFHVCITTYRLVIQDCKVFKRKKWKYLILDEAHLIKNWKSQRWQTLLNFHSRRRILLTGTPLQNDLMELWSLMHFLMPHVFQSHQEFKDWFCNPISGMVDGQEKVNKEVVDRLHNVLRPFILRRLKRDVEKQLPMKHEHVIYCRLSRRQRNLYEDFIASSETQATLANANFFGMISVIMQLRKVCNHPDLFEGRPIISSFDMSGIVTQLSSSVCSILSTGPFSGVNLEGLGFLFTHLDFHMTSWESDEVRSIETSSDLIINRVDLNYQNEDWYCPRRDRKRSHQTNIFEEIQKALWEERLREAKERATSISWWNSLRCRRRPMYSTSLREVVTIKRPVYDIHRQKADQSSYLYSSKLADIVYSPVERFERMTNLVESFMFAIPAARAPEPVCWCSKNDSPVFLHPSYGEKCSQILLPLLSPIRPAIVRRQVYFPDRRLIQFDCGKLQELAILLRKLKSEGHRALIFTQMTKMLDVLEAFINLYGYTYMRLDGSTQPEERQTLMQRFNTNPKIFLFILSTRSGGVGINLVGADTVIFYDSDWNPAMDQQAQDRCHRIGQTREVHIYRLISESTIEENILRKANQKRALDDLVIQSGGYNTEFFKKLDPMELFSGHRTLPFKHMQKEKNNTNGSEVSLSNADVEAALKQAEDEADYMALKKVEQEEAVDNQEFTEEAIGKMEDDEFVNEDDLKDDEPTDQVGQIPTLNKEEALISGSDFNEDGALTLAGKEDDLDMLADVKQMAAAAAAAGQAVSSFENQLRPIDRYAMRFLELWDPIIDKRAVESQVRFEETEWELDRLEKYKEELEADMDDDEEPLVYENWDADFATEAYRQQVEALAQHQLEEELELEAKLKEDLDDENCDDKIEHPRASKPKSKKKAKKAKFKFLKKGSLTSDGKQCKGESPEESIYSDDDIICLDISDGELPHSTMQKKRKKCELFEDTDEETPSKKSKKHDPPGSCVDLDCKPSGKKHEESVDSKMLDYMDVDREQKTVSRSRMGGKISITSLPIKRVFMLRPEKLKKGNIWSRDCVPSPDLWLSQEDAVLCAIVHEYGPNWSLVSDALYGMTAGGFYRGRYRNPIHCCERFRELIQRNVLSAMDNPNNEKAGHVVSGKGSLKVTEDNIRMLLDVAMELPDNELLLQKHFTALLSSVWRVKSHVNGQEILSSPRNGLYYSRSILDSAINHSSRNSKPEAARKVKMTNLILSRKLVADALDAVGHQNEIACPTDQGDEASAIEEGLEVSLEFQQEKDDLTIPLPSFLKLSISGSVPSSPASNSTGDKFLKSSGNMAECRFREASRTGGEGSLSCLTSGLLATDFKTRSAQKPQVLGKHKLPVTDSIKPAKSKLKKTNMEFGLTNRPVSEPQPLPMQMVSVGGSSARCDFSSPSFDVQVHNLEDDMLLRMDKELFLEPESYDMVQHTYVPDVISDLDDCPLSPEYTDIG